MILVGKFFYSVTPLRTIIIDRFEMRSVTIVPSTPLPPPLTSPHIAVYEVDVIIFALNNIAQKTFQCTYPETVLSTGLDINTCRNLAP